MRGCVVRRMGTESRVMTRRLVMGTTPPPIDPIDGDRRARRRTTDRRRGRLGSRLSVRARAFSRYRRSTVRARAMDTNARKNVSVVCLSMQSIRMGKQCDWWRQTPSSAAGGVFVRNRRRRPSTGRERRFERTPRAFVRSFVRSFVRERRRRDDRGATRDASAAGDDEDERAIESVDRWHPS